MSWIPSANSAYPKFRPNILQSLGVQQSKKNPESAFSYFPHYRSLCSWLHPWISNLLKLNPNNFPRIFLSVNTINLVTLHPTLFKLASVFLNSFSKRAPSTQFPSFYVNPTFLNFLSEHPLVTTMQAGRMVSPEGIVEAWKNVWLAARRLCYNNSLTFKSLSQKKEKLNENGKHFGDFCHRVIFFKKVYL